MTHLCPLRCGRMIEGHVCPECLRALRLEVYGRNVYRLAFGKHKSRRNDDSKGVHQQQERDAVLEAEGVGSGDGRSNGQESRQGSGQEGEGGQERGERADASGRL